MIDIDNDDDADRKPFPLNNLKKWRSEHWGAIQHPQTKLRQWDTAYLIDESENLDSIAPGKPLASKKSEHQDLEESPTNPLRKWKLTDLNQIEKKLDSIEIEPTFAKLESTTSKDTIDAEEKEPKKGFFKELISRTKHTLSHESKIPKPVKIESKIPKPKVIRSVSDPRLGKSKPLFQRLLSKAKGTKEEPHKEPVPKPFDAPPLFDDEEPDEFADDLNAQYNIRKFQKNYTVKHIN